MTVSADELRPNLRLVPAQRIRFHEALEQHRTHRLLQRLKSEARLRNPPIVATMPDGDYLLLDGANRVSAFLELEYSHVPVQVVEYGATTVQLKGWHHLLMDAESLQLRSTYEALARVTMRWIEPTELVTLLELRQVFAVFVEHGNACWGLFPSGQARPTIEERIDVLNDMVEAYEGQSKIERIKLADYSQLPKEIDQTKRQLVLFPVLYKEELISLAAQGIRIPTGLTRHLVPGRTLGLNLELNFLTELETDEEKVAHFESYLRRLAVEGRIRFYEEPVFIMNE